MLSWRAPTDPRAGGAETLTLEVLRRAVARGHSATWFAAESPGTPSDEILDGIRIVRRGRQWTVHARAWLWLRRRLDEFDVVVDQVNTIPFLTPLYVPKVKRRLLIFQLAREYWWRETRGPFRLVAPFGYVAEPQYLKAYRGTAAITISESTRAELIALGLEREAVTVLPMAILTPALSELTPKAEPFRVVVIGRLTPAKFIEEGLAAFADVRAAVAGSQLDIAGGGDPTYQDALEEIVRRRGLADAVTFHGRISEVDKTELLTRAHVHLFTSHREGWGLTVNEAGARGTPTVGYSVPGVRDSVRDPRLLATLADGPAGLAQRIVALRADPTLYDELRLDAWSYARALSYEATTDAFLDAL